MRVLLSCLALLPLLGSAAARADGDPAAGEIVYRQCRACHGIGPGARNGIGPVHNGLIGRKAATYPGYGYSAAMRDSGLTWDEATFREYIKDPKAMVPGTRMMFSGLHSDRQISDLLAYIETFDRDGNKVAR